MKKLLLLSLALSVGLTVQAQNSKVKMAPGLKSHPVSVRSKSQVAQKAVLSVDNDVPYRVRPEVASPVVPSTTMKSMTTFSEAIIGNSIYDLQSNRGTSNRISNNGDGTISAVWTFTPVGGANGVEGNTRWNDVVDGVGGFFVLGSGD